MAATPFQTSRRTLMISGAAFAAGTLARSAAKSLLPAPAHALPMSPHNLLPRPQLGSSQSMDATGRFDVEPQLLRRALAALDRHSDRIRLRDRIAIVDFTAPSSEARLHFLDVTSGKASRLLVAHGSGSDPEHTGFLKRFSNVPGSNASSEGAFLAGDYYVGKHGRSQRLIGLDDTNSNAQERDIVIHSAWYADESEIAAHGKLGRSQGCFAVGEGKLDDVFAFLGSGRMIFAARA